MRLDTYDKSVSDSFASLKQLCRLDRSSRQERAMHCNLSSRAGRETKGCKTHAQPIPQSRDCQNTLIKSYSLTQRTEKPNARNW